jgi:hypothetical protein
MVRRGGGGHKSKIEEMAYQKPYYQCGLCRIGGNFEN